MIRTEVRTLSKQDARKTVPTVVLLTVPQPSILHQPPVLKATATSSLLKVIRGAWCKEIDGELVLVMVSYISTGPNKARFCKWNLGKSGLFGRGFRRLRA